MKVVSSEERGAMASHNIMFAASHKRRFGGFKVLSSKRPSFGCVFQRMIVLRYNKRMHATPIARAEAPGKIILFGEHAVVYGQPAIAVPVFQVCARAEVYSSQVCTVEAVDLHRRVLVHRASERNPFARIVKLVCAAVDRPLPPWRIVVSSDIPIAAGLGSGAAISAAIVRAMLAAFDVSLGDADISALVYEVEKIHHGTPSGIDNTVVVYERPIWFVRGLPPEPFRVARPLHLLIADTGKPSPTKIAVGDVRRAWEQDPRRYEALFQAIGDIVKQARSAIEQGQLDALGAWMNANHALLAEIGVSSPELDALTRAALEAGAMGAKLSGAGRGGNMIALVQPQTVSRVRDALLNAGAVRVIHTTLQPADVV